MPSKPIAKMFRMSAKGCARSPLPKGIGHRDVMRWIVRQGQWENRWIATWRSARWKLY